MILPKGTLDFEETTGEEAIDKVFSKIKSGSQTGYLLLIGRVDDRSGEEKDVTGQMVFKEGDPVLCETVLNEKANKGTKAVHDLLRGIIREGNSVEFRTKIDVEPPIAFFKECSLKEGDVDIESFMESFKMEEEERRKREEEKIQREITKQEWKQHIEEWISSGYELPSYPMIMEKEFQDIEDWFNRISTNISKIKEELKWLLSIDEVELKSLQEGLVDILKKAEDMKVIHEKMSDFRTALNGVEEKRKEIEKWVNLWKDEGYNTEKIDNELGSDLETSWNAMTQFMDDIQHLKDAKNEIEEIKKDTNSKFFMNEITDIEFLLNDPKELENIERSIIELKDSIEIERAEKDRILGEAKKIEDGGLDASHVTESSELRSGELKQRLELIQKNASRIGEIREEVGFFDTKDIPGDIEGFVSSLKDPLKIEDYEKGLTDLKAKIDLIKGRREEIRKQVEDWRSKGFIVTEMEEKMEDPIDQLETFRDEFTSRIDELIALKERISSMDHRWLDKEFEELDLMVNDPAKIDLITERIKELKDRIEERESKREMARSEMNIWSGEGFNVEKLEAVIEDDDSVFMHIFNELKEKVHSAKELLSELDGIDTAYFKENAVKVRTLIMQSSDLEKAKDVLSALKDAVLQDHKTRDEFGTEIGSLTEEGWHTEGLKDVTESTPPEELEGKIEKFKGRIETLGNTMVKVDEFDELESKWLQDAVEDLKDNLKRIMDFDGAMAKFEDISTLIEMNRQKRETIKSKLSEWKDIGYITKNVETKLEEDIDVLSKEFDELKNNIEKLEKMQASFDSLDTKHFKLEAEEIEFKLNDPDAVDEIQKAIEELISKIDADKEMRDSFRKRMEDHIQNGFMKADKLEKFLDEEITIMELEFDNFDKEVELFKKYLDKVGYRFKDEGEAKEEDKEEKE